MWSPIYFLNYKNDLKLKYVHNVTIIIKTEKYCTNVFWALRLMASWDLTKCGVGSDRFGNYTGCSYGNHCFRNLDMWQLACDFSVLREWKNRTLKKILVTNLENQPKSDTRNYNHEYMDHGLARRRERI